MDRIWVALGPDDAPGAGRRRHGRTGRGPRSRRSSRCSSGRPATRRPAGAASTSRPPGTRRQPTARDAYRVRIEAGGRAVRLDLGAAADASDGEPDRTETRLLAAAADQVGQALAPGPPRGRSAGSRDRPPERRAEVGAAPVGVARPADAAGDDPGGGRARSARAAALSDEDQRESADAIDREVEYLNRLVTNLLDLSRIEAGALRAERDVFELDDLVGQTLERLRPRLARPAARGRRSTAPPVEVDPVFLDEAVTNALENAIKYTPPGHADPDRGRAAGVDEPCVRLTIEDGGPGVPDDALPRLFDKFYRVPGRGRRIAVRAPASAWPSSAGLIEAMGGRVERPARASSAGSRSTSTCRRRAPTPRRSPRRVG